MIAEYLQRTAEEAEASYREMAADEQREAEALEWIEEVIQYYEDNDA